MDTAQAFREEYVRRADLLIESEGIETHAELSDAARLRAMMEAANEVGISLEAARDIALRAAKDDEAEWRRMTGEEEGDNG